MEQEEKTTDEQKFLAKLLSLFGGNSDLFNKWIRKFVQERNAQTLKCRHDKTVPLDRGKCSYWGTADKGKGMGIRKTTVFNSACEFLDKHNEKLSTNLSTKIRVHSIAICLSHNNPFEMMEVLVTRTSGQVIGHSCGCGNCGSVPGVNEACTEPSHLRLISQEQNRDEVAYHKVLAGLADLSPDLYLAQVNLFRQINIDLLYFSGQVFVFSV